MGVFRDMRGLSRANKRQRELEAQLKNAKRVYGRRSEQADWHRLRLEQFKKTKWEVFHSPTAYWGETFVRWYRRPYPDWRTWGAWYQQDWY